MKETGFFQTFLQKLKNWFRRFLSVLFTPEVLAQIFPEEEESGKDAGGGTQAGGSGEEAPELTMEEKRLMEASPVERRHIIFSGRVQGVGFRYYAMHGAGGLGLTGWVKNLYDGNVEMEVQGPAAAIDHMIRGLENGRWILIEGMDTQIIPLVEGERGFRVKGY